MEAFQIFLVLLGLGIIAISYLISEKLIAGNKTGQENPGDGQIRDVWTPKDEKHVKERLDLILKEKMDDTVLGADDQMSQISNEKIMAVSEFSDQILEKINQNHTEAVFLYNMLNEKETEIKTLMGEIDKEKGHIGDKPEEQPDPAPEVDSYELKKDIVESWNEMGQNNNSQILALYKDGKSVMEIAKLLDLGQGEVKLVVDLSRGGKL